MIGFIKKLLSGILSFLFGLVGGKKSQEIESKSKSAELPGKVTGKTKRRSGYFLELDETDEKKAVDASSASNSKKATELAATTKAKADVKSTPATSLQPAKAEATKTPEATAKNQPAPVELVQTAEGVKVEPAKPGKASVAAKTQTETTFAPKYLAPSNSTNGRRRPGPNMNTFLDMARQVKTSS